MAEGLGAEDESVEREGTELTASDAAQDDEIHEPSEGQDGPANWTRRRRTLILITVRTPTIAGCNGDDNDSKSAHLGR
jgi:hypothetical protein